MEVFLSVYVFVTLTLLLSAPVLKSTFFTPFVLVTLSPCLALWLSSYLGSLLLCLLPPVAALSSQAMPSTPLALHLNWCVSWDFLRADEQRRAGRLQRDSSSQFSVEDR